MAKRPAPRAGARRPSPRHDAFATVLAVGRSLPEVDVATAWGQPALKANGRTIACMAAHPSAEPDSLIVMMSVTDRDLLVEEAPDIYYLKPHYVGHPCVLVRLNRIQPGALRDLLAGAQRYASTRGRSASTTARAGGPSRRSPRR